MTIFPAYCRSQGIPEPVTEYRFGAMASGGPGKGLRERLATTGLSDWRFDYAWPEHRIALEQEGGMFSGGHHARPTGIKRDIAKYNAAGSMGWIVLRCLPEDLLKLNTIELIRRTMETRKAA